MDDYMKRLYVERAEDWHGWLDKIPAAKIPAGFSVQPCPPFGGAIARMVLFSPAGHRVSVYADGFDRLGFMGAPYWEVYPFRMGDGWDVHRVMLDDAEGLAAAIEESARQQKEGEE